MPFDTAALQKLEEKLSAPNGVDITELLSMLDEHFARLRSVADVQAYREGRKPWKKLADEVMPVATFLWHADITGRIRFALNDQAPDAWLLEVGSQIEVGIEVTRVLARSKIETAKGLRDQPVVPAFLGLPDNAPNQSFRQARDRGRILNSRGGIESAIKASLSERLAGKSDTKFRGQTLLLVTPLGSAPSHNWEPLRAQLLTEAEQTAFDRIFLIDEAGPKQAFLLFDRAAHDVEPGQTEF
jgi:hypothetical protein